MKKYVKYLYLLLILLASPVFPVSGGITCSIRYFNKKIYYAGDPVQLRVELFNNSSENFSFQTADPKHFNTRIILKDLTGRELKDKYKFTRETSSVQHVYYRNMTIQPGEVFAFNIFLDDVIDIAEPGLYFIQLEFFPGIAGISEPVKSNIIDLSLRPNLGASDVQKLIDYETGEILRRERKAPDEVVEYTINALQKSEFEKYFLYLDLESIMLKSQDRRERYIRLSAAERKKLADDYRQYLIMEMQKDARTAGADAIIYRPFTYNIIKTWYTGENAEVIVMQKFRYEQLVEVKEYTYRLKKSDGIWLIHDYTVINKGTE